MDWRVPLGSDNKGPATDNEGTTTPPTAAGENEEATPTDDNFITTEGECRPHSPYEHIIHPLDVNTSFNQERPPL